MDELSARLQRETDDLRAAGRYYMPARLAGSQGPHIVIEGREYINLASNNYLGFAADPRVIAAAHAALDRDGFGLGGGRTIYGMAVHETLERRLAELKGQESALVFQTGYDANLAVLSTLFGPDDVIISDAANHASIVDGCRLSRARRLIYAHSDMSELRSRLEEAQGARTVVVVTDGVFSMDGEIAPLSAIVELCEAHGALVYVDDAHGDGVLGATGSGVVEHFGLHDRVAIEVGTLSKAFGGMGGFVAARRSVTDYLFQRSRTFMFSTGHLPPAVAAGLVAALDLLRDEPERLARLWSNTNRLRAGLHALGFDLGRSETPVMPVIAGRSEAATGLMGALRESGVYVQAFSFPVVPEGAARVRVIVSAAHTADDIRTVLTAFERAGKGTGLL